VTTDDITVSRGLWLTVVAQLGVGLMLDKDADEHEASRVFYVAATRARQRLVLKANGGNGFGKSLQP